MVGVDIIRTRRALRSRLFVQDSSSDPEAILKVGASLATTSLSSAELMIYTDKTHNWFVGHLSKMYALKIDHTLCMQMSEEYIAYTWL